MRKKCTVIIALLAMLLAIGVSSLYPGAGELPRPTYDNSLVLSIVYSLTAPDADSEVEYIKKQFGSGLYAPLVCGTFLALDMDWHINPAGAVNYSKAYIS